MSWPNRIDGWCSCPGDDRPLATHHAWSCHAVPLPARPILYTVRIVNVPKASWSIDGWDAALSLAQTLRRAYRDRWVDVKLDGALHALLEPQAVAENAEQLELA